MTLYVSNLQKDSFTRCIEIEDKMYTSLRKNTIDLISRNGRDYGFLRILNDINPRQMCGAFESLDSPAVREAIFNCNTPDSLYRYYSLKNEMLNATSPYQHFLRGIPASTVNVIQPKELLQVFRKEYAEFGVVFSESVEMLLDQFIYWKSDRPLVETPENQKNDL